MKKVLSVLLVIFMLVTITPVISVSAAAVVESGDYGDNVTWVLDDEGVLIMSGVGSMDNHGMPYSPFYNRTDIKQVIIQDGITNVGYSAFQACWSFF